MANVGLQGLHERRYYQGVQGVKGEEGELFGLLNLLKLTTEKLLSRELIDKVVKEELFEIKNKENEDSPENKTVDMKLLFDSGYDKNDYSITSERDPAILSAFRESGVIYSHNNLDVIGESVIEKEKAEKLMENSIGSNDYPFIIDIHEKPFITPFVSSGMNNIKVKNPFEPDPIDAISYKQYPELTQRPMSITSFPMFRKKIIIQSKSIIELDQNKVLNDQNNESNNQNNVSNDQNNLLNDQNNLLNDQNNTNISTVQNQTQPVEDSKVIISIDD